jgi:hypothetical protein
VTAALVEGEASPRPRSPGSPRAARSDGRASCAPAREPREERLVRRGVAELLGPLAGRRAGRAAPCRVAGEDDRAFDDVAVEDGVHEPGAAGVLRPDRLAAHHHLERFRDADEASQPLRSLRAWNDAEVHFGQAQARLGIGQAIVPGHRQLEAAAERRAVERHHDRLREVLDELQQPVEVGRLDGVVEDRRLELADVGAGRERAARCP